MADQTKAIAVLYMLLSLLAGPAWAVDETLKESLGDRAIVKAVSDELSHDSVIYGFNARVKSSDGIVTLYGTADNLLAKQRAGDIAKSIKGVRVVVNDITVVPAKRTDLAISNDVEQALRDNPRTESYETGVTTTGSVVTLSGEVQSWQEKQLAGKVAKSVKGVKAVVNEIDVSYTEVRSDDDIAGDVRAALVWDRYLNENLIDVKVSGNEVRLEGVVGSVKERDRAVANAWVAGVNGVDASDLKVRHWAEERHVRDAPVIVKNDARLKAVINDALQANPHTAPFDIEVDVNHGRVGLEGEVDTLIARREAEQVAHDTLGVDKVNNRIRIRPARELKDASLQKTASRAVSRDPYIDRYDIEISVDEGVAVLHGKVDNAFEKARAQDIVSGLYGIVDVDNQLKTVSNDYLLSDRAHTALSADRIYDWYVYDAVAPLDDADIRTSVSKELWWSPYVDSDAVKIEVDNGVVTLKGTVASNDARRAATANALEGGAGRVINRLEIETHR